MGWIGKRTFAGLVVLLALVDSREIFLTSYVPLLMHYALAISATSLLIYIAYKVPPKTERKESRQAKTFSDCWFGEHRHLFSAALGWSQPQNLLLASWR